MLVIQKISRHVFIGVKTGEAPRSESRENSFQEFLRKDYLCQCLFS